MGWDSLETWKDMYMYYTMVEHREEQIGLIFVTAFQSTDSKKVPLPLYIWPEKVLNMGVYYVYCDCVCEFGGLCLFFFFRGKLLVTSNALPRGVQSFASKR